jgi:hypothetical protein
VIFLDILGAGRACAGGHHRGNAQRGAVAAPLSQAAYGYIAASYRDVTIRDAAVATP